MRIRIIFVEKFKIEAKKVFPKPYNKPRTAEHRPKAKIDKESNS